MPLKAILDLARPISLALSLEEFSKRFVKPRISELAAKMKRNEPLTPDELQAVEFIFGLEHDPDRVFIVVPK